MSRSPEVRDGEQGYVLVTAMMLIAVTAILATTALQRGSALARDNVRERGQLRALHAAEGGLARARHALRTNPAFAIDQLRIGRCTVVVNVTRRSEVQWEITARAFYPIRGERSITVGLSEGFGAEYWYRALR